MRAADGLHGAWLLARGEPAGLAYLAVSRPDAAGASFWALILGLPAFVALHALGWATTGMPPDIATQFARDLASLLIGWLGFLVLMHAVCARIGRATLFQGFVIAWNWCSLLQLLMLVAGALPGVLGAPDLLIQTVWLVAVGWSVWLSWFATRLTLSLPGAMAACVIGLDLAFELLVGSLVGGS